MPRIVPSIKASTYVRLYIPVDSFCVNLYAVGDERFTKRARGNWEAKFPEAGQGLAKGLTKMRGVFHRTEALKRSSGTAKQEVDK